MRSLVPALAAVFILSGCDLVGDVLELGFWLGVIVLVIVVALVWFLIKKFTR